jgi:hypothetical protein
MKVFEDAMHVSDPLVNSQCHLHGVACGAATDNIAGDVTEFAVNTIDTVSINPSAAIIAGAHVSRFGFRTAIMAVTSQQRNQLVIGEFDCPSNAGSERLNQCLRVANPAAGITARASTANVVAPGQHGDVNVAEVTAFTLTTPLCFAGAAGNLLDQCQLAELGALDVDGTWFHIR